MKRSLAAAVIWSVTLAVVVVLSAMSVVGNRFPSNVLTPLGPEGALKSVSTVFTQGWGFFTRDAREDRVSLAVVADDGWSLLDQDAIVRPEYLFGISRASRAQSIDINEIYQQAAGSEQWTECATDSSLKSCLSGAAGIAVVRIAPVVREPICSSDVALVAQTPIPFGYRDLTRVKKSRVLPLKVECDRE
jgi:antimicrobial peptide system SdpA family protein